MKDLFHQQQQRFDEEFDTELFTPDDEEGNILETILIDVKSQKVKDFLSSFQQEWVESAGQKIQEHKEKYEPAYGLQNQAYVKALSDIQELIGYTEKGKESGIHNDTIEN